MKQKILFWFFLVLSLFLAAPPTTAVTDLWQPLAGPTGGSVAALAISPDYPADFTLFAGLRGQGVYRAIGDTADWQSVSPDWHVVDLAISPDYAADQTIFALTGLWTTGYSVHRSTDRGDNWETAVPATISDALGLAISPDFANDQTIYLYASSGAPTYLSTDGGATFVPAGGWFDTHGVNALAFSPDFATDQTMFALVPFDGLYQSQDGGTVWTLTNLTGSYTALAVSPDFATDQTLIATDTTGQLHRSDDGGATWTTPPLILGVGGQHTLRFSPTFATDQVILAASSVDPGPYRSEDGGLTWAEAGWYDDGILGGTIFDLAVAPNQDWSGTVYAATSIGTARSPYSGNGWYQRNNGLATLTTRAIAAAPGSPDLLLAGTSFHENMRFDSGEPGEYDGSLQYSYNGGANWKTVTGRLDRITAVAFSPDFANDETAFAAAGMIGQHGYADGGVYRSTDGLDSWEEVLSDLVCTALAVSPDFANDSTVWTAVSNYTDNLGIYRSQDGGTTWSLLSPDLAVVTMAPSPNFAVDQTLFAGTGDAGLLKSEDGGMSWTAQATPPVITALAVSPAYGASQTLLVGAQTGVGEPGAVYRSTDGGAAWELLDTGIPPAQDGENATIASLAYAVDGSMLVGVRYGDLNGAVYRSVDGGATWAEVGDGLADTAVHTLLSTPANSLNIYAGVNGGLRQIEIEQGQPAEPGTWASSGPRGGSANALVVSPDFTNDGIVFAGEWRADYQGSQSGLGFIKSSDGGQTWALKPDPDEAPYNGTAVHDYALSPDFASDGIGFATTGGGGFRTDDGGESWRWLGDWDGLGWFLGPIAVAPDFPSSGHIMAGASYYSDALYLSVDGGQTWTRDDTPSASSDIAYSPNFAVDQTAFTAGYGLFKTDNAGLTWTEILTGAIRSLAVSPDFAADNTLMAGGWGDFYLSTDGGSSWITRTVAAEVSYIQALAVSPQFGADGIIFAGANSGLYWSADGGLSWALVDGFGETAILSLAISPNWPADPTLLIGTSAGVYRLAASNPPGGKQFTQGFAPLTVESLTLSANEQLLLAGTMYHGLYGSQDAGQTWQPLGKQGSGYYLTVDTAVSPDYANDQTIFAAQTSMISIGSSLYRTTDGGQSWDYVYSTDNIGSVVLSPQYASDQTVFVASYERALERSDDGGDTWTAVGDWPVYKRGAALHVVLPPNYPTDSTILAGGSKGFWRLPPGATMWEAAASGIGENHYVTAVAISPAYAADQTLLAAAYWVDPITYEGWHKMYRSTDGGVNWEEASIGLPNTTLEDVAFSPLFAINQTAYATTAAGELYRSRDGGMGWTLVGEAPERPSFHDVVVNWQGDVFVASDSGVWQYNTPAQDILINGGFEHDGGWELPVTRYQAGFSGDVMFNGRQSAQIGIINDSDKYAYSSVRQTVTLPANVVTATLTYHTYLVSSETVTATQTAVFPARAPASGDAQYGLILDPDTGDILDTIFWELSNDQTWQSGSFDLSGYAGQTVVLHFGVYNDGLDGPTGFYLDDTALVVYQTDIWTNHLFLPAILKP